MPLFFKDKPVERLLGEGIEAEHLNEDTLGRALDAVYALRLWPGTTLRPKSVKRLGLSCEVGHTSNSHYDVNHLKW